jgi:hypothetical protein
MKTIRSALSRLLDPRRRHWEKYCAWNSRLRHGCQNV